MVRTTIGLAGIGLLGITGCNGGGGGGSCGSVDTTIAVPETEGYALAAPENNIASDGDDVGWFDFDGDLAISLGSEVGSGAALQFVGLRERGGTQCAGGAQFFISEQEFRNGSDPGEGWTAGGTPFAVELSFDGDLVLGTFSGTFVEDDEGNDNELFVEGAFRYDRGSLL